jgi:protein SCO1/2
VTRLVALALLACLLTACGGTSTPKAEAPATPAAQTTTAERFAGAELKPPRTSPPIALHDAAGRPVTLADQRGRFVLVTFLYTNCPDVCPLIAQNLNGALRQLGSARKDVRVLAVSVDPKGDTAAAVRRYAVERGLLPQFRYLIGSRPELRKTWAAWHVLAVERDPELVDHAAYTALVDRSGRQRVLYDSQVKTRQVLHDLRVLMRARD